MSQVLYCKTARERELVTRIERAVKDMSLRPVTLEAVNARVRTMLPEMSRPESTRPYHTMVVQPQNAPARVEVLERERLCMLIHVEP